MQSIFLTYKSSLIHYLKGGEGKQLLLCFHGYGESSGSFTLLEASLGQEYTLIAIDLPFHGETQWKEGLFFSPEDLLVIIQQIARGLTFQQEKMLLIGYSMGGRVALSLLEKIPEKTEKIILVAPDGLRMNGWYWLATQNRLGNLLFRLTMQRPGWFLFILRIADTLRLVNRSIYKFTVNYIDNALVRDGLYKRWTTMRGFRPDIPVIQSFIRERQIPVRLLYGRYDRIIRWERAEEFRKGIEPHGKLVILDTGHQLLQDKNLDRLIALLKD